MQSINLGVIAMSKDTFKIGANSPFTGKLNFLTLPISPEIYEECFTKWTQGALIQDAFPMLSASEREFIKTGITDEDWEKAFT